MNSSKPRSLSIFLLSGGRGHTADQVIAAALAQFDQPQIQIIRKPGVRTIRQARAVVRQAAEEHGIICHTLVAPKIRAAVATESRRSGVATIDVLGPLLTALDDHLGLTPRGRPGLSYELRKEQFDRIDAVDFTLAHDDGQRLEGLRQADVVLVGVSRVSKSVTCFYLASRGVRAANVPLLPERGLPRELVRLPRKKVIGLTMNANRLQSIREARLPELTKGSLPGYTDKLDLIGELRLAHQLMTHQGWRIVDVSYSATEEVAQEILTMLGRR